MRLLALLLALCLPLSTALAETREERVVAAKAYVAVAIEAMDIKAMITTMWQPVVQAIEASGKPVSEAQKAEIDALYQRVFTAPLQKIFDGQSEIMADLLTLEQINELTAFYSTENGRKIMAVLPEVMARIQPQIIALAQETTPQILPEISRIVE